MKKVNLVVQGYQQRMQLQRRYLTVLSSAKIFSLRCSYFFKINSTVVVKVSFFVLVGNHVIVHCTLLYLSTVQYCTLYIVQYCTLYGCTLYSTLHRSLYRGGA